MPRWWLLALISMGLAHSSGSAAAGDIRGKLSMPPLCAPSVNPAVIWLEPKSGGESAAPAVTPTDVRVGLVRQRDLRFQPRVQAMMLGGRLRFTNEDQEPHNVHLTGAGVAFNQTIQPGETLEVAPKKPGLLRLACDIHIFMRGYVMVADNPWITVCDGEGAFRLNGVPPGEYTLHVWHELGEPLKQAISVAAEGADLGTLALSATAASAAGPGAPVADLDWPTVLDRISVKCAQALETASQKNEKSATRAVSQIDDAYLGVFEASDMEVAVASLLGYDRVIAIESQFRLLRRQAREVANGVTPAAKFSASIRKLMSDLSTAARELQTRGVARRSQVLANTRTAANTSAAAVAQDSGALLLNLRRSIDEVAALVEQGQPEEAAAHVVTTYFESFEPIERTLAATNPGVIRPMEARFAILRGRIESGLAGSDLDSELARLIQDIEAAVASAPATDAAAFGTLFLASFATIAREGVEIILILTILGTLITKAGSPSGARKALYAGVAIAVVASVAVAIGLGSIVSSARAQTREVIEGAVMLTAAAVLFYVSYWLIAQSETKRWLDYLKSIAAQGAASGKFAALGVTAFLAVFREGAEIVLMYQGLLTGQSQSGLLAIGAGLIAGLAALAVLAVLIRATSVRLPLKPFFQITGALLFALAVIFAGHGVLGLQTAQVLRATEAPWIGSGIPALGVHPTVQGLAVQGILLAGALVALGSFLVRRRVEPGPVNSAPKPAAAAINNPTTATPQTEQLAAASR